MQQADCFFNYKTGGFYLTSAEEIPRGGSWEHSMHLAFLQHTFRMLRESGGEGQERAGDPARAAAHCCLRSPAPPARPALPARR